MLVFDDMEPSEKLKLYDSGAYLTASDEDVYRSLVEYRTGDVLVPRLDKTEALAAECTNALNVFQGTGAAISDGALGLRVVLGPRGSRAVAASGRNSVGRDHVNVPFVGSRAVT